MQKKKLIHFFNNVLVYLGIHNWNIEFVPNSTEGFCWKKNKKIDIGILTENPEKLILHEITHINTCRFCNNRHSYSFWRQYQFLMDKFLLEKSFDDSEKIYKRLIEGIGYYRLCYKEGK